MSVLNQIQKPQDRPGIITICGDAGMGKTSLACAWPDPIVVRAEDGLQSIPVDSRPDAFPVIEKVDQLWEQLTALIKEDHNYKTLIIDSVTQLEQLFIKDVIESDPKKPRGINQALGGYGNGFAAVSEMHQRVRKAAGILNAAGMHIVFIAHADTETIELPDQDAYTRYSLRLNKRSMSPYVDNVDMVAFLKLQSFTVQKDETSRAKAISDGSRVAVCYATAANISKNRYGITEDLPVEKGVNPFIPFIKSLSV